jgi:hypothetical protein
MASINRNSQASAVGRFNWPEFMCWFHGPHGWSLDLQARTALKYRLQSTIRFWRWEWGNRKRVNSIVLGHRHNTAQFQRGSQT